MAQEIKKTHFQFGSGGDSIPQSLSKATYQNLNVENNDSSVQQKKMSMMNRKSNFIFGLDNMLGSETTSNQAYNSKQFQNLNGAKSGTFSVNTLRKGNFRLGFETNTYETTAQSNFTNKNDDSK